MWIAIRIGVLYGAPILAIIGAVAYFIVMFLRVRRGAISRERAALRYSSVLLLPIVVVLVIWGAGEISSYLAAPDDFHWNLESSRSFLLSLLPLAVYVGAPIVALVAAFWLVVQSNRQR
ncbi:MAG TPA: hypothetical protein VGL25_03550 [Casimicrobiaceae bacterium]|jgi:hypothetical protein